MQHQCTNATVGLSYSLLLKLSLKCLFASSGFENFSMSKQKGIRATKNEKEITFLLLPYSICKMLSSDDFSLMWHVMLDALDKVFAYTKSYGERIDKPMRKPKKAAVPFYSKCCLALITNYLAPHAHSTGLEKWEAE